MIDCIRDPAVPGMVEGDGSQLEASQQPCVLNNCDFNFVNVSKQRQPVEQPEEQPRTAAVFVVGGDVGTAHRRERDRDKEKEEEGERQRPCT